MGRQPAPATTALADQLLAALRAHHPLPLPTPALAARADGVDYPAVGRCLRRLEARGAVRKLRLDGWRAVFWGLPGGVSW